MENLIFYFFLSGISLLGIFWLFWKNLKKFDFPENFEKESYFALWKKRIEVINPFKKFSFEIFLQKLLTKIRILSLKVDNWSFNWLKKIRLKYQEKKEKESFWEKFKKDKKIKPA